jgi:hypothetical protein
MPVPLPANSFQERAGRAGLGPSGAVVCKRRPSESLPRGDLLKARLHAAQNDWIGDRSSLLGAAGSYYDYFAAVIVYYVVWNTNIVIIQLIPSIHY